MKKYNIKYPFWSILEENLKQNQYHAKKNFQIFPENFKQPKMILWCF